MRSLAFLRAALAKDLRRRLADPAALAIWIGIPLALGGLMALAFGGRDARTPTAHVLLVDRDQSTLSRLLVQMAGSGRMQEVIRLEEVIEAAGNRRIEAGEASALLVLPPGLQDAVLYERPVALTLRTNPAQRILPDIVKEGAEILVQGGFYAQQLFGDLLRQMAEQMGPGAQPSSAQVAQLSARIYERLQRLGPVLQPAALALDFPAQRSATPGPVSFGLLFLPGMVLMSALFIAQGVGGDIWHEEELGTLRRFRSSPQPMAIWLGGKMLSGAILMAAVATVAVVFAVAFFGIGLSRAPIAIAWTTFAGTALLAYFCVLQTAATSARGGELLSSLVLFPLMMIGGSFFPFETMPAWMAAAGRWTPNGLALVRLKELLSGTPDLWVFVGSAAAIGLPALLAFLYATRQLERRMGAR